MSRARSWAAALCALAAAACASSTEPGPDAAEAALLGGTTWQLVEFRSNDDAIGVVRPRDPSGYTMTLQADGRAAMRLDCNRATGSWSAQASDADSGSFAFSALGMTKVYCQQPSMDQQIARDAQYVRAFLVQDGRLHLDLMADAGTYVWERIQTPR
jgi:heat shock protein HslJ